MIVANEEQLAILKQGVEVWNKWREDNPDAKIDLRDADLSGADLKYANLNNALLCEVNLRGADLAYVDLAATHLGNADLSGASLDWANLQWSILESANLTEARLLFANLVSANFKKAILIDCNVHGSSVWNVNLEGAKQSNIIITNYGEPAITVDSLEVAQFVYLILNNKKIREVLDTIGKKGVLILGRFNSERKHVLDALRNKLRQLNFVPMMFDFEGATTKDFTETVKILAGMCRFIIADITSPKSSPLELQAAVPDYKVPFVPIIQEGEEPFSMFANLQSYPWMFDVLQYKDSDQLISVIDQAIIQPALIKADELNIQKAEEVRKRHAKDYL